MSPGSPSVRDRLKVELTAAMRSKDRAAVAALRSALGAIDNAEAVPAPPPPGPGETPIAGAVAGVGATEAARRRLTESDIAGIVEAEIADLRAGADDYDRLGRPDRAAELRAGADALEGAVGD